MNKETDKRTQGTWIVEFARWTKDAPVAGFVIKSGKKEITGLSVQIDSHIISDEYYDKIGDLKDKHFNEAEVKANAEYIVKACNNFNPLLEALKETKMIMENYRTQQGNSLDMALPQIYERVLNAIKNAEQ